MFRQVFFLLLILSTNNLLGQKYPPLSQLLKHTFVEIDSMLLMPYQRGDYMGCVHFMNAGREKARIELGDQDSVFADYSIALGFFSENVGQFDRAERLFLEAKAIFEKKLGTHSSKFITICIHLANLYQQIGQYNDAEAYFLQAIELFGQTKGKSHAEYATALNNLAFLYQLLGRFAQAEPLFKEAINIYANSLGKTHAFYAKSLASLSYLYQSMNELKKAEELLTEANAITAKNYSKTHPEYASSLLNLALLYQRMEDYATSEKLLLDCANIYANALGKTNPNYATTLNYLAMLYVKTSRFKQAEKVLLEAQDIFASTFSLSHPYNTSLLNHLARLYMQMKQDSLAWEYLKNAFKSASDIEFTLPINKNWGKLLVENKLISYEQMTNIMTALAIAFDLVSKEKQNKEQLLVLTELANTILKNKRKNLVGEKDKLRMLAQSNTWLLKTLSLLDSEEQKQAFQLADRNKAVLLLEAYKNEQSFQIGNFPNSLSIQEANLIKKRDQLQANLYEIRPPSELDSLRTVLNKVNYEIQEFKEKVEKEYPKYADFKYIESNLDLEDFQAHLDAKSALIEYVIGDSSVHIFYVDQSSILWKQVPINPSIFKKNIQDLHQILSNYHQVRKSPNKSFQKYSTRAYGFYQQLIAPLLPIRKEIKNLIIVPDGELGHLPFETFLVEMPDSSIRDYRNLNYLIQHYNLSYNYSATLWKQNKESKTPNNNKQILAMAADYTIALDSNKSDLRLPSYQKLRTSLDPLPAAIQEVQSLEKIFEGMFAYGLEASEKKIKAVASNYAVIHLAMHGFLDAQHPILSSLAFTEDSDSEENNFWQAHEISKLPLNANLVVLSACETGYGKFEKGNGIASLARAFMYAGAPALIVSLWQVNDYVTSEIMQNLYSNLADGMPKNEALSKAKIDYIKNSDEVFAHPALWSPFVLIGNEEAIHISRKQSFSYGWIVLGILFLGFVGVGIRKKNS